MTITDVELARLWLRDWRPADGPYAAPAASVTVRGAELRLRPTGMPLAPAAALLCPPLAQQLAHLQGRKAMVPAEPTIAELLADYPAATAPLGSVLPEQAFLARLNDGCRRCGLWDEGARQGRGRCESVKCTCSRRLLWLPAERCPEGKWPA